MKQKGRLRQEVAEDVVHGFEACWAGAGGSQEEGAEVAAEV